MRKLLIIVLLGISSVQGQNALLMNTTRADLIEEDKGMNKLRWNASTYGGGFMFGPSENDSIAINLFKSYHFFFGSRFKLQPGPFFAVLFDQHFNWEGMSISQDQPKVFPDTISYRSQNLFQFAYDMSLSMRFNFNVSRGNHLGFYLDLGGYGGVGLFRWTTTKDRFDVNGEERRVKLTERRLGYMNRWRFGAEARLGFGRVMLYGRYRLNNTFKSSYAEDYPEPARITAGIQFDI